MKVKVLSAQQYHLPFLPAKSLQSPFAMNCLLNSGFSLVV